MAIVAVAPSTCRDGNLTTRRRHRGALSGGVQDVTTVESGFLSHTNTDYDVTSFAFRRRPGGDGYVSGRSLACCARREGQSAAHSRNTRIGRLEQDQAAGCGRTLAR